MASILKFSALAIFYTVAAASSLLFEHGPTSVATFWPANGFLLAALLLSPSSQRPALAALCAAANLGINLAHGKTLVAASSFTLANILEVLVALKLASNLPGGTRFLGDHRGVLQFFTRVALVSSAIGAAVGGTAAWILVGGSYPLHLATWFMTDASSLAVITPAILAWKSKGIGWPLNLAGKVEFAACLLFSAFVSFVVFRRPEGIWHLLGGPVSYLTFPFLVWAAIRFGARGASAATLITYSIMAWYTSRGYGTFAVGDSSSAPERLFVSMQAYPFAAAFCALFPAVLFHNHRRTEQALRMRESRFGNLWNSKLIGIYVTDPKGMVKEANETFLAMIRRDRGDLEAGRIEMLKMATPEYLERAAAAREQFMREGQIGPFEREWILESGDRFHSLVYATRMEDSDLALGMVMNMEELHATQGELRRRESRYRDLQSSSLVGVFVTDLQGRILEANDTFLAMIKRTRADLEDSRISSADMASMDYLAGAEDQRRIFLEEGKMGPYDRDWLLQDGTRLNTLFFATRMEEDGNALCMVIDRNELKRTQTELRAVETRFKRLFDANIVGVAVVSDLTVVEANDTFLRMVGYDRRDLEARILTVEKIRQPQDGADIEATREIMRMQGRLDPQETVYLRKDGTRLPVYRGLANLDDEGKSLLLAIDISELKKTQARLEDATESARTASLAKSDFLAHMSHEIRTPMNGVLGMLGLIQGTNLTPEQRSYARACRESGEHLLGLINQVLDFSKIESGSLELDHSEFSLSATLEGAVFPLIEPAQSKGIELVKTIGRDLPDRCLGDSMRLQQVLINLIGNAVKFTDRGEVRVSASLLERGGARVRIGFEILDQGPGIRKETLSRLFRPFRQGDDSLSRKAGGTGLGLAISKELVERMGGSISAESSPGKGSAFRFDVWLESADALGSESPAMDRPEAGKPRALILEPHPDHGAQLRDMLEAFGFAVDQSPSIREVEDRLTRAEDSGGLPDIAILAPPGNQVATVIKTLEALSSRGIPALFSLPFMTQSDGPRLLEAGAAGIITKPHRRPEVLQALRSALPHWSPGSAGTSPPKALPRPVAWKEQPRVLVVDDHPVNLTVATSMLRKLGCLVVNAPDGPSALAAVTAQAFHAVFMDCQMPGMDGFQATRGIRGMEKTQERLPVIALTAHAVNGFKEKCLAAGMDDYISKPFTSEAIERVLRRWIPADELGGRAALPAPNVSSRGKGGPLLEDRLGMFEDGTAEGAQSVKRLVSLFLATSEGLLDDIRHAERDGNRPTLARALHKLKGGCGTIGALAMTEAVRTMESTLEKDPAADRADLMKNLEKAFHGTREALDKRMG